MIKGSVENITIEEGEFSIIIPINVPENYKIIGISSWSLEYRSSSYITSIKINQDNSTMELLGFCLSTIVTSPWIIVLCDKI